MKIERGTAGGVPEYYTVLVDKDELKCSQTTMPYSAWIGTISAEGINLWEPAATIPRGYKAAAMRMLEQAQEQLLKEGKFVGDAD